MCCFLTANAYTGSKQFMSDLDLIYQNAKQFNGPESIFAAQALVIIGKAKEFLSSYEKHLDNVEQNISSRSRHKSMGSAGGYEGNDWDLSDEEVQEDGEVEMDMTSVSCLEILIVLLLYSVPKHELQTTCIYVYMQFFTV